MVGATVSIVIARLRSTHERRVALVGLVLIDRTVRCANDGVRSRPSAELGAPETDTICYRWALFITIRDTHEQLRRIQRTVPPQPFAAPHPARTAL